MSPCDVTGGLASSSHTFRAICAPSCKPPAGSWVWEGGVLSLAPRQGTSPQRGGGRGTCRAPGSPAFPVAPQFPCLSCCMMATEAPFSSRQCLSLCPLDTPARQGLSYLLVRSRGSEGQVVTGSFGFNPRPASPKLCRQIGPCPPATPLLSPPPPALLLSSRARSLQGSVQAQQGVARPAEAKAGRARGLGARLWGGPSPRQDWGKGSLQSGSRHPSPRGCLPGGCHRGQGCA